MKCFLPSLAFAGCLLAATLVTDRAPAAILPVQNPGFDFVAVTGPRSGEINPRDSFTDGFGVGVPLFVGPGFSGDGQDGTADIFGWTGGGRAPSGAGSLGSSHWAGETPQGATGYVQSGLEGTLSQKIAGVHFPDTEYWLTVDIYNRASGNLPLNSQIRVELWGGGTRLDGELSFSDLIDGKMTATFFYQSDSSVPDGSSLTILLGKNRTGPAQVNFDNVQLATAPEPASGLLLGLGGLLGAWWVRRRR